MEGARGNLPDSDAQVAALAIKKLVSSLKEEHILIVLISGNNAQWVTQGWIQVLFHPGVGRWVAYKSLRCKIINAFFSGKNGFQNLFGC